MWIGGTCLGVCVDGCNMSRCVCGWVQHVYVCVWMGGICLGVCVDRWNMSRCVCGWVEYV